MNIQSKYLLKTIGNIHKKMVFHRRTRVLGNHIAQLLPQHSKVLDVGCGDGSIDKIVLELRPDVEICGIDVFKRPHASIPMTLFDGVTIPFSKNSFDTVMFIDVLHHTTNIDDLLEEAHRVAQHSILIKDHTINNFMAFQRMRFMDWVGNSPQGVSLPYNYLSKDEWIATFGRLQLKPCTWETNLGLYPAPARWLFEYMLHFIVQLDCTDL